MVLGRPNVGSPAADLGFRHVSAVRAWAGSQRTRFEVDGIVHRHPVTAPVTARMAGRLVAAGIPLVVHQTATSGEERSC